jgi:pimeloyl-ACP methyl ester carboxylesterase
MATAGDPGHPAVLLIHGSMDRSAGLLKLSRRLDPDHFVIRYDRRGYGRSTVDGTHPGPFDIDAQVVDALEVLARADVAERSVLVVGHSYGGNVALALAARCPARISGVVVYETPLSWEPWWPGTTAGSRALATEGSTRDAAERFMRRLVGDSRWEALPEGTREVRRAEGAAMVGELTALRSGPPWLPEQITVPVMAGFGEHGAAHHQQGMRVLGERINGCCVVELPGCRHDAPLSHPDLFRQLLIDPIR